MPGDEDTSDKKKSHRARQSGVKAEKKKLKTTKSVGKDETLTARQRNPKAFAINSAISAERNFRRKEDLTAKKQHIPIVDKTPDVPPPVLVAVVGPPKVGKSTVIRNLIKNFTRTNVTGIKGPITIVTSKKRRITLLECNNDVNSMIDIAKCADLVLLLCDASYGFEMEIFEFLNICQVHGMPKIMGVLTHLDVIRNPKTMRTRKKELKKRFWTEVYDGAKLFYLSGLIHGEYLRNEIQNLGRFISVMKFRPLTWKGTHSHVLVDRVEDVTNTEMIRQNVKCDRDIVLYGYVRGVPMNKELSVHIAGYGDARMEELSSIPDPCPMPGTEKKRNLLEKERMLYAPMSGVGGIVYDKDAVYIELQGSHSHKKKNEDESAMEQEDLLGKLIEKKQTIDTQIEEQEFRLFSDGAAIKSKDFIDHRQLKQEESEDEEDNDDSEEEDGDNDSGMDDEEMEDWRVEEESEEENPAEDSSDEEYQDEGKEKVGLDSDFNWRDNLAQKARDEYLERQAESGNLMKIVYGVFNASAKANNTKEENEDSPPDNEEEIGGLFKRVTEKQTEIQKQREIQDKEESCFFEVYSNEIRNWLDEKHKMYIQNCFVTGKWKASEDAEELLKLDDLSDAESEVYGDFEDLETGEKHKADEKEEVNEEEDEPDSKKRKMTRVEEENLTKAELMAKKMKLKAKFDSEYDNGGSKEEDDGRITGDHQYYEELKAEAQKQSELNKKEFEGLDDELRSKIEGGYRPGMYVRMSFKGVTSEFITNFNPTYPVLVGGLNMSEENVGFVNCKVKKHRWYKKILKTGDPLIVSIGWRRFQTIPIFCKVEDNFRQRYLKYTPNHVTCSMTFWGPITPQNTGFLALQTVANDREEMKRIGFRIAATGAVTELDKSTQIMKKLKLVGTPFKIYKKTAFVQGMFTSSLEVAKFEGAKIKTVSGIRGQIKKAHTTPEGSFRATFEDKILISDIVFCRTWFKVEVPRFYAPVTSLLLPELEKDQWRGMKTTAQIKREKNIQNDPNVDSLYRDITREPKAFKPLKIPKTLQRSLPYKDKPKHGPVDGVKAEDRIAVIQSPHEQKIGKMMKMIKTNYDDKKAKEKQEMNERAKKFKAEQDQEKNAYHKRQQNLKRKMCRAISKVKGKPKS